MAVLSGDKLDITFDAVVSSGVFKITVVPCQTKAVLHIPVEYHDFLIAAKTATLLEFEVFMKGTDLHVSILPDKGGRLFVHYHEGRGSPKLIELFGGISGWGYAASKCGFPISVVVECHLPTAKACSLAMDCQIFEPADFLEAVRDGRVLKPCVVHGDATDSLLWMAFSLLNVAFVACSPPCQPWSTSGAEAGLSVDDGKCFSKVLERAGQCRVIALVAENVPGISKHRDFQTLIAGAQLDGMKVVCQGVFGCHRVAPLIRDRWLAVFVHASVSLDREAVQKASQLSFASDVFGASAPGPTMASADVLLKHLPTKDMTELFLPTEVLSMLNRSDLVPKWLESKVNWTNPEPVLTARSLGPNDKLGGVMARYGSQHLLPMPLLQSKGLQTTILDCDGVKRYFAPIEIAAALCFPPAVVIDAERELAYQQVGNAICVLHAALGFLKVDTLLGSLSPFVCGDAADIVSQIQNDAIKGSNSLHVIRDGFRYVLKATAEECSPVPCPTPAKKQRTVELSPTVPFDIHLTLQGTETLDFEPCFSFPKADVAAKHDFCRGGLMILKHDQHHWVTMIHAAQREILANVIIRALPHAKEHHFESFSNGDVTVCWRDEIACTPTVTVVFTPSIFECRCTCENGAVMSFGCDVTWTVDTLLAFVAGQMKCNINSLALSRNDLPTMNLDFLAGYESMDFNLKFKATMPGYVSFAVPEVLSKDPGMAPRLNSSSRWLSRHPYLKVTKTGCVDHASTFAQIVRLLFPDLVDSSPWQVTVDGEVCDAGTSVGDFQCFTVEWMSFRPLLPCEVCRAVYQWPIDCPGPQVQQSLSPERWIRTPFASKPKILRLDETASVGQLAASFVARTMLNTSVMCQCGGSIVDPTLILSQLPSSDVLAFKIAPLLGGVKANAFDNTKKRIRDALEAHGVQSDQCQDRMLAFVAKADLEALAKVGNDDSDFWSAVKAEANRINFRLVYRSELQTLRKVARRKPPSHDVKKDAKHPGGKTAKDFVAHPSNIRIDPRSFTDDNGPVDLIDASRFGPDQRGMAIMTLSEANRYSKITSLEALAILVIGRSFASDDKVFALPAFTMDGSPIVIQAALRQFGDTPVEFATSLPSAQIQQAAATAIEVHIIRSEVTTWKESSVPLHYLGVHIPEIRGDTLASSWAWKTWTDDRKPKPFREASYWHGYIRIPDAMLDSVLARSGSSGIYLAPKSEDKRHDDRFTAITVPNCSLAELQKKACGLEHALGIVKVRDQFAIRCRRQHACQIRSVLLPESAYVSSGQVQIDEHLWVLKHVPHQIDKKGIDDALLQASWNAHAVRAQGLSRWINASKEDPPALHLCFNDTYVLVEPFKRPVEHPAVTFTAKHVKVDTTVATQDGMMQMTSSTRVQELRAELSEHLESKLAQADRKIGQLQDMIEKVQANQNSAAQQTKAELTQLKEEQSFTRQKIIDVESNVVSSGQSVIQTMQSMMTQMQSSLEASMRQMIQVNDVSEDGKRLRTGDDGKTTDQFCPRGWKSRQQTVLGRPLNACLWLISLVVAAFVLPPVEALDQNRDNYPCGLHFMHNLAPFDFDSSLSAVRHSDTSALYNRSHFRLGSFDTGARDKHVRLSLQQLGGAEERLMAGFGGSRPVAPASSCKLDTIRFGEADHPGPLHIGTFNPSQIFGNENTVSEWGPGIWGGAETSHTAAAQNVSMHRFRNCGFNSVWSTAVPCYNHSGALRGRAAGTAIISHLNLAQYPGDLPRDVAATARFVDSIVDVGHDVRMYVACIYGPAYGLNHHDPWAILSRLCEVAFSRASQFKGPAIVMGDFNVSVDEIPLWHSMLHLGWVDAAAFDANRRSAMPRPTSRGQARKSFILINQQLLPSLITCDTTDDFEFDTHPLLLAEFDLDATRKPVDRWRLPMSTDHFSFNPELLELGAVAVTQAREHKFQVAIDRQDSDEALRQINLAFEETWNAACVDADGKPRKLPQSCIGRGRKSVVHRFAASAPVIRKGRNGDFNPDLCQPTLYMRRMIRQVRRLQSLRSQLMANENRGISSPSIHCWQVWRAIVRAPGFPKDFQTFMLGTFGIFVPDACPGYQFVQYICLTLQNHTTDLVAACKAHDEAVRKERQAVDIAHGGSKTFCSVRDLQPQPFQSIVRSQSFQVARLKWPKEGRSILRVSGDTSCLDASLPVVFQEQEAFLSEIHADFVVLDRPVRLRAGFALQLCQKQVVYDPDSMQQLTNDAWSKMWCREPCDDTADNWPQFIPRLQNMSDCPSMEFQPLTLDDWRCNLKAAKHKSARGACGYTPRELTAMPDCITLWILRLLTCVEQGDMPWPPSIMTARVVMLAKSSNAPTSPLQIRPITITSRLYRLWSRLRSMQIAKHLQQLLPPEVSGFTNGVSADLLAATVLCTIERAITDDVPCAGMTLDLVKCYNLIPRLPILCIMSKLGIPTPYLVALRAMFNQLQRVLQIAGSVGSGSMSTTGVPEGCCFSIICMMSLSLWAAWTIEAVDPSVSCIAYADNWEVIADCVAKLQHAIEALLGLIADLRMEVSDEKSWVWASHAEQRKQLRSQTFNGQQFPLRLVTDDLGCDVSYCKRVTKVVTRKRIQKAQRVLNRVGKRKIPKKFKATMTKQLSQSIVAYGSELTYVTPTNYKHLRSAACRAVGRSRGGANPHLSMFAAQDSMDPELAMLMRRCFFWRRFFSKFASQRDPFLQRLANHTGRLKTGPAAAMARTFADHGWKCLPNGIIRHDTGWHLDWLRSSRNFLRFMLTHSWNYKVCRIARTRAGFDLVHIDMTVGAFGKLTDEDKACMTNFHIGKHITNDALSHYARGVQSSNCPLCDNRDGRWRRVFDCPALADIRDRYPDVLHWLESQHEATATFGLVGYDPKWLHARCRALPCAIVLPKVSCRGDGLNTAVVYTDGSAMFPHDRAMTTGAGAFIECCEGKKVFQRAKILPGPDHSPFRAEVWAIALALNEYHRAIIHVDCAAAVAVCQMLVHCRATGLEPHFRDHHDLWWLVWKSILTRPVGAFAFVKVQAHQTPDDIADPVCRQHAVWNNCVDSIAKTCVNRFLSGKKKSMTQDAKAFETSCSMLQRFNDFWVAVNTRCFDAVKKSERPRVGAVPDFQIVYSPGATQTCVCIVPEDILQSCPFGVTFAKRVVAYFNNLPWDLSLPPVSFLELYIDFSLTTATVVPVLLTSEQNPKGWYALPDQCIEADAFSRPLAAQSRIWTSMLKWLLRVWPGTFLSLRPRVKSMSHCGYLFPAVSLAGTPLLRRGVLARTELWKFLHPNGFAAKNLSRVWKPSTRVPGDCRILAQAGAWPVPCLWSPFALAPASVPCIPASILLFVMWDAPAAHVHSWDQSSQSESPKIQFDKNMGCMLIRYWQG